MIKKAKRLIAVCCILALFLSFFGCYGMDQNVSVTGVTINKESVNISEGKGIYLIATVLPESATNKGDVWSSSDTAVASVSETGWLSALKIGTTVITATTLDGGFEATCDVEVVLSGGTDDPEIGDNSDRYEGVTSITMWAGGQWVGDDLANMEAFIDKFNEEKPLGFTVELEAKADYEIQMAGAFATGTQPDLFVWDRFNTPTYAKNKFLYPIDELIARDNINPTLYQSETIKELNYNGQQYGIPLDLGYWGLFVNNELVDVYNATAAEADKIILPDADDPETAWTWDQLYDAADKLTIWNNGILVQAGYQSTAIHEHIVAFYNSTGAEFLNEDMTEAAFGPGGEYEQQFRDTLTYMKKLYDGKDGKSFSQNGFDDKSAFISGSLAIINQPNYFQTYIQKNNPDMEYTFIPQPRYSVDGVEPEGSVNGGLLGGFGLAIPNPTANSNTFPSAPTAKMEAAWAFIKWWACQEENVAEWTRVSSSMPAMTSLYDDPLIQDNEMLRICAEFAQYQRVRPRVSGWVYVQTGVFNTYIQSYVKGQISLDKAIEQIVENTKQTLKAYR